MQASKIKKRILLITMMLSMLLTMLPTGLMVSAAEIGITSIAASNIPESGDTAVSGDWSYGYYDYNNPGKGFTVYSTLFSNQWGHWWREDRPYDGGVDTGFCGSVMKEIDNARFNSRLAPIVSDVAMVYTAPETGKITIGIDPSKTRIELINGCDDTKIAIYKNDTKIWPLDNDWQLITAAAPFDNFTPLTNIDCRQGDQIIFRASRNSTESYNSEVRWCPTVTYTEFTEDAPALSVASENFPESGDSFASSGSGWRFGFYDKDNANTFTKYTINDASASMLDWNESRGSGDTWYCGRARLTLPDKTIRMAATANKTVMEYTFPEDGTVTIATEASKLTVRPVDVNTGPVRLAIFKGKEKIWPLDAEYQTISADTPYNFAPIPDISGRAGSKLYFVLYEREGDDGHKEVMWNPTVEYTSYVYNSSNDPEISDTPIYRYSDGFATTQWENQWGYMFAAAKDDYAQKQSGYYSFGSVSFWAFGPGSWQTGTIGAAAQQPGTGTDSIIAWKAPYTGTIEISMPNAVTLADSTANADSGDGAAWGIFKYENGDTQRLYPASGDTGPQYGDGLYTYRFLANTTAGRSDTNFTTITLTIRKNEYIWFRANMGGSNNAHDSINMQPVISYTATNKNDPGVSDDALSDGTRVTRGTGADTTKLPTLRTDADFPGGDRGTHPSSHDGTAPGIINWMWERFCNNNPNAMQDGIYTVTKPTNASPDRGVILTSGDYSNKTVDFSGIKFNFNGSSSGFVIDGVQNLTIRNLTLDFTGLTVSTDESAIIIWNSQNIRLENCQIISSKGKIMTIEGGSANIVIDRLYADTQNGMGFFCSDNSTDITIINSIVKAKKILEDRTVYGTWIENNVLHNYSPEPSIFLSSSNAVVAYNTLTQDTVGADSIRVNSLKSGANNLIARNIIPYHVVVGMGSYTSNNTSVVGNIFSHPEDNMIIAAGGKFLTVAQNIFATNGNNRAPVTLNNVENVLITGNIKASTGSFINNNGSTKVYGNDIPGAGIYYDMDGKGADLSKLPQVDITRFVGTPVKERFNIAGRQLSIRQYIINAINSGYNEVILPPGAFASSGISISSYDDFSIIGYGTMMEFENPAVSMFSISGTKNFKLFGVTMDHKIIANTQGTIIAKSGSTVTWKADEGYIQNLLDSSLIRQFSAQQYKKSAVEGENPTLKAFNDRDVSNVRATATPGEFTFGGVAANQLSVGDKVTFRGVDVSGNRFVGCENTLYEDVTVFDAGGFGVSDYNGEGGTVLNRFAITPGPAPNNNTGAPRIISTCDATHATNLTTGFTMTNCVFRQMNDDATNMNGQYGYVESYNESGSILRYATDLTRNRTTCPSFKDGEDVYIYTREGRLLFKAVADGGTYSGPNGPANEIKLKDIEWSEGASANDINAVTGTTANKKSDIIIINYNKVGANFVIDNCLSENNRARGFLIKAPHGSITNTTMIDNGIGGILIQSEIMQNWQEAGFAWDLLIKDNYIKGSSYFRFSNYFAPINITTEGDPTSDKAFMNYSDIIIEGNVIRDRYSPYAINLQGINGAIVRDNDFGTKINEINDHNGVNPNPTGNDNGPSVRVAGSYDIVFDDNIYVPGAPVKVLIDSLSSKIRGNDIGKLINDYAEIEIKEAYENGKWYVEFNIKNISDEELSGTFELTEPVGFIQSGTHEIPAIAAGESYTTKLEVLKFPGEFETPADFAACIFEIKLNEDILGNAMPNLSFLAAVNDGRKPVIGQYDANEIWANTVINNVTRDDQYVSLAGGRNGADDIGGELQFAWDEDYFYVYANVKDDVHNQPATSAGNIWGGDSIQIAIDTGRTSGAVGSYGHEMGFALANNGNIYSWTWGNGTWGNNYSGVVTGAEYAIKRDETTKITTYEIAIPWSFAGVEGQAPAEGSVIGVAVVINESDVGTSSDNRKGYMGFFSGIGNGKDATLFGNLKMIVSTGEEEPEPTIKPQVIQSFDATSTAGEVDKGTVTFTWTDPNNTDSAAKMYELYLTNGGNKWLDTPVIIDAANTTVNEGITSATLTFAELGITKSGDYDFRIKAVNRVGAASFVYLGGAERYKLSVVVEVLEPTAKPKVITDFNAVLNGEAITFTWVNPNPEKSATTVETYSLYKTSGGSVWLEEAITINAAETTVDEGITSITLTFEELGIAKSGNYDFRIKARNNIDAASYVYIGGENRYKVAVEIESLIPTAKPKAVTAFNATSDGETVIFTWINPNNSATAVEYYELTRTNTGNTWQTPITIDASEIVVDEGISSVTYTLEELGIDKNGSYDFRIKAINDEGVSALTYLGGGTSSDVNRYRLNVVIGVVIDG